MSTDDTHARHAMAMVRWAVFRPSGQRRRGFLLGGQRIFDYATRQRRLIKLVGNGGTLWLVTSRRKRGEARRYHLAYKLVNCSVVPSEQSPSELFGRYAVRGDMRRSVHFGYNDVTDTLQRLVFSSGKPMCESANMGLRLLSLAELSAADVDVMSRFEHKVLHGRTIFVSYAREDERYAERLETELSQHDVQVRRDRSILSAGDTFEEALRQEARSADCFVVLLSSAAAASDWVGREIRWAIGEYRAGGFVKRIVPVILPGASLDQFFELREKFHCREWPSSPDEAFFERVAADTRGGQS